MGLFKECFVLGRLSKESVDLIKVNLGMFAKYLFDSSVMTVMLVMGGGI